MSTKKGKCLRESAPARAFQLHRHLAYHKLRELLHPVATYKIVRVRGGHQIKETIACLGARVVAFIRKVKKSLNSIG